MTAAPKNFGAAVFLPTKPKNVGGGFVLRTATVRQSEQVGTRSLWPATEHETVVVAAGADRGGYGHGYV